VAQLKADNKTSWRDNAATVKRELQPQELAMKPAASITPNDIVQVLRGLAQRSPYMAQRLQGIIHAAYEAAMKNRFKLQRLGGWDQFALESNPARNVGKIDAKATRDRALNGRDLGLLWLHLNASPARASIAYRFLRLDLLLGGQRCQQFLRAKIDDVDEFARTITLRDGKGRRKKPRHHILPLSDLAWKEVSELLAISHACDSDFLFVGRAKDVSCHHQTISNATSDISKVLASVTFGDRNVAPFIYLDLRRTTESRMGEIGISREMKQQLLSHGLSGVQETHYDRYAYVPQKAEALKVWQEYMLSMAEAQRSTYLQTYSVRGVSKTQRSAFHLLPRQADHAAVRFWIDTEFTQFDNPALLSVGLVAEDGISECYVELLDAERESHCSDFVREEVLPLLGLLGVRTSSQAELSAHVTSFLQATAAGCSIQLMYDCKIDKDLLSKVLEEAPQWDDLKDHLVWCDVSAQVNASEASAAAKSFAFDASALEGVGRNHALIDARALRAAYLVAANVS
jgi:integrase